ncbi:MAG: nitrilase-related carbon-nitrogen hydrolase [Halobacteriota archaeon]
MVTFTIGLCQYALGTVDDVSDLHTAVCDLFDRAGPADLYVLPELLFRDTVEASPDLPWTIDPAAIDSYLEVIAAEAADRNAVVVGGSYYRRTDEGQIVNRLATADPSGRRTTYDKCHPTPNERSNGVTAGDAEPPMIEHRGVSIGVLTCYDVEFPGRARSLVDRGAEVLAVPSWTETDAGFERVRRCSAARAVENQCFVAQVPLVGEYGDATGSGRSAVFAPCDDILGPHGTRLSLPRDDRSAASVTVALDRLRQSRREAAVRPYTDAKDVFDR